jgi:N-acylneuraminate cytidylyltransferase
MIEGKSVIAVIPARGGSKGLPGKNIREIAGKPLIAWTILEAKKSKYIDRLILSSEDEEIINAAKAWDCEVPFVRPKELAQDDTPGIEPVLHAIEAIPAKYDYALLLQPTSPLRLAADIDGCLEMCHRRGTPACVTVTEPEKSPYWMYRLDTGDRLVPLMDKGYTSQRRQDLPTAYVLNGAVYAVRTGWVEQYRTFLTPETAAYVMPRERSIDVDSEQDIIVCELLLSLRGETCS